MKFCEFRACVSASDLRYLFSRSCMFEVESEKALVSLRFFVIPRFASQWTTA